MHIFIVYAHPSKESFTHSILMKFIQGIESIGHTYELSDLYQMNFIAEMSLNEYVRESSQNTSLPIPEDVKVEQEKMNRADVITFVFPLWWSDCPAILKGWFDRVYTIGYAYSGDHQETKVKTKKGLVICTAGHAEAHLEEVGIAEGMRKIMIFDRLQNIGIKDAQLIILGGMSAHDDGILKSNLEQAYNVGSTL